jgi:hypothetical protein
LLDSRRSCSARSVAIRMASSREYPLLTRFLYSCPRGNSQAPTLSGFPPLRQHPNTPGWRSPTGLYLDDPLDGFGLSAEDSAVLQLADGHRIPRLSCGHLVASCVRTIAARSPSTT